MTARRERKSCNETLSVSMPSIVMVPRLRSGVTMRKSAAMSDDFPAPVRPMFPTFSPALTEKLKKESRGGESFSDVWADEPVLGGAMMEMASHRIEVLLD